MRSTLALGIMLAASVAAAESAADLVKQGLDALKAGDYPAAIAALEQAQALEPSPDTLFALAQAERMGGHCDKAVPHYKLLLQSTTDLTTGQTIQSNLALCAPPEPDKPVPPPPLPPAPPVASTGPSRLTLGLLGGGALSAGVSFGLFLASRDGHGDADAAQTFADHVRIDNRADRERIAAYVTLVASAGLIGYAIYRWKWHATTTEVAVTPVGAIVARGHW